MKSNICYITNKWQLDVPESGSTRNKFCCNVTMLGHPNGKCEAGSQCFTMKAHLDK